MYAKPLTAYQSDKLKVISLLCIILVLYLHAVFHEFPNEIQGMTFNIELQRIVCTTIARCAVPTFFSISGFLFFRNLDLDGRWSETYSPLWPKLQRRVRSLLVPYLFAAWFLPVALYVAGNIPIAAAVMNGGGHSQLTATPLLPLLRDIYIGKGWTGLPASYPLWFLRNLIVIVAFSPALIAVMKLLGGRRGLYIVTAALLIYWLIRPGGLTWLPGNLLWFLFGACTLGELSRLKPWLFVVAYIPLCTAQLIMPWAGWTHVQPLISAIGLVALWTLYDSLVPRTFLLSQHPWLHTACGFSFFIYLFHEPLLHIVRKLLVMPLGPTSLSFALSYLLSPWIFAALWVLVGVVFKKYLPRLYGLLTGSR